MGADFSLLPEQMSTLTLGFLERTAQPVVARALFLSLAELSIEQACEDCLVFGLESEEH